MSILQLPGRTRIIRVATLLHDLLAAGAALYLGLIVRLGPASIEIYWREILLFMAISGVVGYMAGLNGGMWRYASLSDLGAIVKTATATVVLFTLFLYVFERPEDFSRSALFASWVFMIALLSGSRIAYRAWRNRRAVAQKDRPEARNTLLLGATDSAEIFIKAVTEGQDPGYRVVGIVDEHGRRMGRTIRGVRVWDTVDNLDAVVTKLAKDGLDISCFVLATNNISAGDKIFDSVADVAQQHKIELLRLPDINRLREEPGSLDKIMPQPVVLEDLLPRRPISLNSDSISGLFGQTTVLVTGGGGSIGSELCRQVLGLRPKRLVIVDNSEYLLHEINTELRGSAGPTEIVARIGNVRDRKQVMALFEEQKPDLVFHAAALKHVPIVENQPLEGLATNVLGTRNVADAALQVNARAMVLISTDKAVNPANVMGASKRMAESYCQALDVTGRTHFVTVRFGNVLGSAGSVVPLFSKQIAAGGPVTVTHPEIERYFMTIPEAVQLVLHATGYGIISTDGDRGRIFVLDMGQPVKIVDVARKMIRLARLRPDKDIAIKFIGLRPGEKLFEELFDASEALIATNVPGVLSAAPRFRFDHINLAQSCEELGERIGAGDVASSLQLLKRVVPEFVADERVNRMLQPPRPISVPVLQVVAKS